MGRTYELLDERLTAWLQDQPVFFVATAPLSGSGHINCSPKGNRGELAVADGRTVLYLDQTGSGIETVAHLHENGRIVLMFCAFTGGPRIVRLHGTGRAVLKGTDEFEKLRTSFPAGDGIGVRSIIMVKVDRISDSCGYGVPLMTFESHRPTMDEWAARKGDDGIHAYWAEKNATSVDGLPGLSV